MENSDIRKCNSCKVERKQDMFRNKNICCNICCDSSKRYRDNNKEKERLRKNTDKAKESRKKYVEKIKDEIYTCPLCKYDIKKYKKWQHEQSLGHKYLKEKMEKGEELEPPDKIFLYNGVKNFQCKLCNTCTLEKEWASHLASKCHAHFTKLKEQKTKVNPTKYHTFAYQVIYKKDD